MKTMVSVILLLLFAVSLNAQENKLYKVSNPIQNKYIVVLKKNSINIERETKTEQLVTTLNSKYGGKVEKIFSDTINGYVVETSEKLAKLLSQDPEVEFVEEDGISTISTSQTNAPWNLDRIDQRDLPLTTVYDYFVTANSVHTYIVDTGIRATHNEFGGRASVAFDAVNDGQNGVDCNGHGTAVASVVGGSTYGVAKSVQLHAVRVNTGCSGDITNSNLISGINWVQANRLNPAVVNMSLNGGFSAAVNTSINSLSNSGVTVVVAAGNDNDNACNYSPSSASNAITVAATMMDDSRLIQKKYGSNFGSCVDIFAPGSEIQLAYYISNSATTIGSGTSFASPHVAGVAALLLQNDLNLSSSALVNGIKDIATINKVINPGINSPNSLLYGRIGDLNSTFASSGFPACVDTPIVTAGTGVFKGSFAYGYGNNPALTISKLNNGNWNVVASGSQSVTYIGIEGSYQMKACITSGSPGYFGASFQYPNP